MKTFRQFIKESQWMYHGSTNDSLTHLTPNRDEYMLDRAVGSHFAADPKVSEKFAKDLYGNSGKTGTLYRMRAPKRSELFTVPQKIYSHGLIQSDQHAVGSHIISTVFSHPDHKQMFIDWIKHDRRIDDDTANEIHGLLNQGKAPSDKEKYSTAASNRNSFHSYIENFAGSHINEPRKGFKKDIVQKYISIMKKKGYKGLVYKNTSPRELEGIPKDSKNNPRPKGVSGSNKSYIIFEPQEYDHALEKVK
jgi:hypothetical protein